MQGYSPGFAQVYNVRWGQFASDAAPLLRAFYEQHAALMPEKRMLDLCCGTGQLALHFLEHGYTVTGLDLSPAMLTYARQNAAGYVASGQARFMEGDAADFTLDCTVGLVLSTFDALNHLPDLEAFAGCCRSTYAALDAGGWFIFDLNTRRGLEQNWTGVSVQDTVDLMLVNRALVLEDQGRAYTRITGFVRRDDGLYERFEQTAFNTMFALADVARILRQTGFAHVHFAAMRDLHTPLDDPETHSRVWIVAQK